jgi:SAM-dependent methyltransferase
MPLHPSAARGFAADPRRYQRGRPGYPAEAIDWALGEVGIGRGAAVVELGAGTGKLTSELLVRGLRVIAVEPVERMAAELSARLPGVQVQRAPADATGLPDGQADAVLAAQSFHWFATRAAVQEIRRLLRSRGWLVLLWNRRDQSHPVWRAVTEVIEPLRGDEPTHEGDRWRAALSPGGGFGRLAHRRFAHSVTADREGFEDRVLSISYVACQPPEVRRRIRAELGRIWAGWAPEREDACLPYHTDVYLTRAVA